ncbi:NAD(P)/FAD-dependent oxidoreductase [Cellulomonas sp. URHD0024]|uniref:phytoene desaturase family protein n=1 Tax=Cellulomonas sp. URHD0024 TaxID=1302620 RepID=UPI000413E8D5|nr:NAD(P)/FAD-dependent oxidoreductase [Cellulomonas sp. URHD0024]
MDGTYDAIVVGGGHNGLTAAAYLARVGLRVLVLERGEHLGGATRSERVFAGVDAHVSRYSYLVSLLPRRVLVELGLPIRLRRRRYASYTPVPHDPTRGLLVDTGDDAATATSFASVGAAGDVDAWRGFGARTAALAARLFPTMTEPLLSSAAARALLGDADWRDLVENPIGDVVAATFRDDLVRGVVLTDALIGTFASTRDRGRANRCFLYHVIGGGTGDWDVPVGGMGAVERALEDAGRAWRADLRTRATVTTVDPGGRHRPAEVTWSDDDGVSHCAGAQFVLAACAPAVLERLLGDEPSEPAPEGSQLKVNMVLSRLPRLRSGIDPAIAFAGTFHVNETATQLESAHADAAAGRIPALPPVETYCHSLTDHSILGPELRATGAHTLTAFGLHMPARLFVDDPDGARATALAATIASVNSVLAEPIEDCLLPDADGAPCLEVRSPVDLEADVALPGGHIFHRDLSWPWAEDEDDVGRWGVETAHPRVLLAGAGARRGGGVSAIPGRAAAMVVVSRT